MKGSKIAHTFDYFQIFLFFSLSNLAKNNKENDYEFSKESILAMCG